MDSDNKDWYQITAIIYWSFDSTRPVYRIKFLVLQIIKKFKKGVGITIKSKETSGKLAIQL